jgi:hypothetical protein
VLGSSTSSRRKGYQTDTDVDTIDEGWRKGIDVNGDGRLGIIDAEGQEERLGQRPRRGWMITGAILFGVSYAGFSRTARR